MKEFFQGYRFEKEVKAEFKRAREELQVCEVPIFIINGKTQISGGRASDFFLMKFHKMRYLDKFADDNDEEGTSSISNMWRWLEIEKLRRWSFALIFENCSGYGSLVLTRPL